MEGNEAAPGVTVAKISNGNTRSACVRAIMTRLKQRIFATDKTYHQPKCSIKWTETQTYNILAQQVCVQLSTYTDNVAVPTFAHCTLLLLKLIDISCPLGPQQQTSHEWDRQTDTVPFHTPCSAYYVDSENNQVITCHNFCLLRPEVPLHAGSSVGIKTHSNETTLYWGHCLYFRRVMTLLHFSTKTCLLQIQT